MNLIIAASSGGVTDILRETAETFGWNWKLFLSQVISFCIVAFLLQRFAYKPILAVLEERRRKIEEGQLNAEKIKKELAEAEKRYQEIVAKANADAQKMIDEARESAAHLSERKQQEAITAAEQIIAKAREASSDRARPHNGIFEARAWAARSRHHGEGHRESVNARKINGVCRRKQLEKWPDEAQQGNSSTLAQDASGKFH